MSPGKPLRARVRIQLEAASSVEQVNMIDVFSSVRTVGRAVSGVTGGGLDEGAVY